MAGGGLPCLGRVKLSDLIANEGLPSDCYRNAITTLSQSLAQYSAAIIQLPATDSALLRSSIDSARLYFHQRPSYPPPTELNPREWCKTSGYYSDPQSWQETFDYRPGLTPIEPNNTIELPPSGLVDIFSLLGKASRDILDAICFSLNLRSSAFMGILDNIPLKVGEISSSVLSICCHSRPSFQGAQHHEHLVMFGDHDQQAADKSLITIVKPDRAGLHLRDFDGRWMLVDGDLGPQEAIIYPGLALYQATAGYMSPAFPRIEMGSLEGNMYGRCSVAFKLMPKSMASLNSAEMSAAGHGIEAQFQLPISVDDFMQRSHSTDHIFNRHSFASYNFPPAQEGGSVKQQQTLLKRKKNNNNNNNTRCKPLPPSKRLRLEAQRVLKERVQEIADKKGIKLRFCNLKECEAQHMIQALDSPCGSVRMEIGWPAGVPFVHPHDLPNKAKLGFLEAYEPGWSASQDLENQSP